MANTVEIIITGKNLTKPEFDKAVADARKAGKDIGAGLSGGAGEELKKDLPKDVEKPLEDSGRKGGQAAGKAAGGGISPLIVGAFAAAATVGPALVLAATATAVIGAGVLITKGNAQLAASYAELGEHASAAIQAAAAPLIPSLLGAVQILDQGVAKIGPELKSVFSAVAPDVTAIASGLVSLVSNTLPGMASGLRALAPYAQDLAVDFGKLGSGLGGFFQQLGSGAGGGMTGLNALVDVLQSLLVDVGRNVAALSNGLGPALHDIADVAIPVVNALSLFTAAIPPRAIEAAAVATAALFAAFKVASLAGIVADGTSFLGFLGKAAAGEIALTGETGLLTGAMTKLGLAADLALGPLGLVAVAATGAYVAMDHGVGISSSWASGVVKAGMAAKDHADAVASSTQAMAAQVNVSDDLTVALNAARSASTASAQQSATGVLASLGLSKGISSVTDGLYNSLTAYSAATGAASGYNSILQALNGTTASLDDAQNSMAQQLLTLKTSFKANADSMDLNTQAGINNRQSLSAAAKTAVDLATAQYQATGDMGKANQTLQQQENQILNNIGVTGTLRDKVKAYLDQIMQIPKGVTTNVTANTDSAVQHVKNVIKWIDGQSASFYVGSTGPGARAAQPGLAHGGVRGAAAGGPRGGLTWVGENGPELIPLQPGTTVHSNPDSQRMASQGGGGGVATIVLEVAGNSDDWLVQALRHAIRVRGGNGANSVQIVLGQNF